MVSAASIGCQPETVPTQSIVTSANRSVGLATVTLLTVMPAPKLTIAFMSQFVASPLISMCASRPMNAWAGNTPLAVGVVPAGGVETELHIVGRKGLGFFRYVGAAIASSRTDIGDKPTAAHGSELIDGLMTAFIEKKLDALYVVYAKYNSPLSTPPVAERVLPVTPPERKGAARDYLLFPNAEEILTALLPLYVRNAVYRALVETVAGEQGARRTAMKAATDNAGEILNVLRRTYNRARQAQITQEIAEIVGGAEALSG